jgi:hypothetical protein
MAHSLRPFRQYDEHDVVNLFAYSGDVATPVLAGKAVKIVGSGFMASSTNPIEDIGSVGASFANTVSSRYGTVSKVAPAVSGDAVLGLTLMDIRETDENGEKLVFNPRKAAEMGVVISGQTVPVLTRGVVLYSGLSAATAGASVYLSHNSAGDLTTTQVGSSTKVGKVLGVTDANGFTLLKIEL